MIRIQTFRPSPNTSRKRLHAVRRAYRRADIKRVVKARAVALKNFQDLQAAYAAATGQTPVDSPPVKLN